MEPIRSLKPNRWSFLVWTIFVRTCIILILAGIISLALPEWSNVVFIIALSLLVLGFIWRGARFRKERYELYPNRIIVRSGGIFSDRKTELALNRVTHVTHTLPWLEYAFFRTGTVRVQSAGSIDAEAVFRNVSDSTAIYEMVEELLRQNGFSLKKSELLIRAKPNRLAVVLATARAVVSFFFLLFFLLLQGVFIYFWEAADGLSTFVIPALLFFFLLFIIFIILWYLHLSRRTYYVFSDAIVYEEGFMTKRFAFLPAENLSDSSTRQTFIDRLLDLYDLKISVQGSGSEVHFSNLREGKEVDAAIDRIIDAHQTPPPTASVSSKAEKTVVQSPQPAPQAQAAGTYRPQPKRALLPLLFLAPTIIVPFIFVFLAAAYLIRAFTETYEIRSGRVVFNRRFLGTTRIEFTADKVTEIEFVKGILDRFTGTMTAHVKSIGSGQNVTLYAIPDTPEVRQTVLSVQAIAEQPATASYPASWSLWSFIVRVMPGLVVHGFLFVLFAGMLFFSLSEELGVFVVLVGLALLASITFWLVGMFWSRRVYRDAMLSVHSGYIRYSYGWLRVATCYTRFGSVKDLTTRQYWRSTFGEITVNIAGEEMAQQGQQQASSSQHFTAAFIPEAFRTHEQLLEVVGEPRGPVVLEARPQARNAVVWMVVFFPLILFIPLLLWSYSRRVYHVLSDRVEYERGVLSRIRVSVLYGMLDHVRTGQGLTHKIFGNGFVALFTTGSSRVELTINPVKEYAAVAAAIEREYR